MCSHAANLKHIESERVRLFDLKFVVVNNYKSTHSRNVSCSLLADVFTFHKKSLKRLEKKVLRDKYSLDREKTNVRLANGRSINIWRYIQDLKSYCKTNSNFNTTIKYGSETCDIAQVSEAIFWHRKTLHYLEELEKDDGCKCEQPTSNEPNQVEPIVSSPERDGESGRTFENQIDKPSTSKLH